MGSNTFVHERGHSMKTRTLATKLPADLVEALDTVCKQLGLRKNFVVEAALKEKIEDLLDAEDLREAVKEATGFHSWEEVKAEVDKGGRK
jgi:predicted DNA-binding protein